MSALGSAAADYLAVRRALGYKLDNDERLLASFVAYLDSLGIEIVTVAAAVDWASGSTITGPSKACATPMWARSTPTWIRGSTTSCSTTGARDWRPIAASTGSARSLWSPRCAIGIGSRRRITT